MYFCATHAVMLRPEEARSWASASGRLDPIQMPSPPLPRAGLSSHRLRAHHEAGTRGSRAAAAAACAAANGAHAGREARGRASRKREGSSNESGSSAASAWPKGSTPLAS